MPTQASALFRAEATDAESGIRELSLTGELLVRCESPDPTELITIRDPIRENRTAPTTAVELPVTLGASLGLDVGARRGKCGANRFLDLSLVLRATATNGAGTTVSTTSVTIEHSGPDELAVGTFNLYHPGDHRDDVFERWGRDLGSQVDILLITEAYEERRTRLLTAAAGLPYVVLWDDVAYPDLAIASRAPLRSVQRRFIDRPGRLATNDAAVLSAVADIRGRAHQIIVSHWAIRDGDSLYEAGLNSPSRRETADAMVELIDPSASVVVLGGDFNALSHTNEVRTIAAVATDSFTAAGFSEGEGPCPSDHRIDYLFFKGPVRLTSYDVNCVDSQPSDHPFLFVTLGI